MTTVPLDLVVVQIGDSSSTLVVKFLRAELIRNVQKIANDVWGVLPSVTSAL